ncbi:MAG: S8 family serine peptidase [Candidatus Eremiobacteraeota bacterium]|nr:S8 family serine peptidase [Candidatus Eremiobacteraeota bacterium]
MTYRRQYRLPDCTVASGCLQIYNEYVQPETTNPSSYPDDDPTLGADQTEEILDAEMVSVTCPTCALRVVEVDRYYENANHHDFFAATTTAAATLRPAAINMSFSWDEDQSMESEGEVYFSALHGATLTVSSGDAGYVVVNGQPVAGYPAASVHALAVGGVFVAKDQNSGAYSGLWGWSGAGAGCSAYLARPAWQPNFGVCNGMRAYADVAAVARNVLMYTSYCPPSGNATCGWTTVQGTSISSPLIAGMVGAAAGINRHFGRPAKQFPGAVYANAALFNDITQWSNPTTVPCPWPNICNPAVGWDGPTGLGLPKGLRAFE